MRDGDEVKICPKCKGAIRKVLKGSMGDRKEVEICDCPPVKSTASGWGRE